MFDRDPIVKALIAETWFTPTMDRLRKLIELGVDLNAVKMADGHTLLMMTTAPGHPDVAPVEYLVAQGVDVNAQDQRGYTALLSAVLSKSEQKTAILLKAGANPNLQDERGTSPLIMAAGRGYASLVKNLLAAGADPNLSNYYGRTALHSAAAEDRVDIVRLLLDHGANIEASDHEGRTPLASATSHGCTESAGLLRLRGANRLFDLGDRDPYTIGFTASMNALSHGCPGFFFNEGGHGVVFMDAETALPVHGAGSYITRQLCRRIDGHNDGVREFIKLNGLPWNSREPWLKWITHPGDYVARGELLMLMSGGPEIKSPDEATTLQLKPASDIWTICQPLLLSSSKLWPEDGLENVHDFECYETDPAPREKPRPFLGQHWSSSARSRDVNYWSEHKSSRKTELCWGPDGSELAFFQKRHLCEHHVASLDNCVLDLQLGLWLSSRVRADWEQHRRARR